MGRGDHGDHRHGEKGTGKKRYCNCGNGIIDHWTGVMLDPVYCMRSMSWRSCGFGLMRSESSCEYDRSFSKCRRSMQVFITILGLTVPSYGLCIAAGMITANLAAFVLIRRRRMDGNDFIILEAYTILGAFLGAKLFYLWVSRTLIDWSRMADPAYFNEWMRGGFVFYGGLILGLASAFAAGRIHRIDTMLYVKRFIFLIPWIHGFGRIGCFLAGCCYGIPWHGMFAVTFPAGCAAPFGTPLFPIQLVEAACLLLLTAVLFARSIRRTETDSVKIYLVSYAVLRFFLEYVRADSIRGKFLLFSTSQWISLFLLACVWGVSRYKKRST